MIGIEVLEELLGNLIILVTAYVVPFGSLSTALPDSVLQALVNVWTVLYQ
jgi:hypothetical protein